MIKKNVIFHVKFLSKKRDSEHKKFAHIGIKYKVLAAL